MKSAVLPFLCLLLFAALSSAQERELYIVNFEATSDVRVESTSTPGAHPAPKPYVSPASAGNYVKSRRQDPAVKLIRKTAQVTMSVYDGYAQIAAPMPIQTTPLKMAADIYLNGFSTGDSLVDLYIVESSRRYNVDPLLIYAQMSQESSFKPGATSYKGASGLMQLMPATARRLGVTNIYDRKQNIEGGVKYMRILLDLFGGDIMLALAGYNAGEGAVIKYSYQIPPYNETRDYVQKISARYRSISNLLGGNVRGTVRPQPVRSGRYRPEALTVRLDNGRTGLVNR